MKILLKKFFNPLIGSLDLLDKKKYQPTDKLNTVELVGDYINIMKTNFDFNYDLYHTFKQHVYTKKIKTKRNCKFKKLLFNYM